MIWSVEKGQKKEPFSKGRLLYGEPWKPFMAHHLKWENIKSLDNITLLFFILKRETSGLVRTWWASCAIRPRMKEFILIFFIIFSVFSELLFAYSHWAVPLTKHSPGHSAKRGIMLRMLKQNIQAINIRLSNAHAHVLPLEFAAERRIIGWINKETPAIVHERERERENYIQLNFRFFFISIVPSINWAVEMSTAVMWLKGDPAHAKLEPKVKEY